MRSQEVHQILATSPKTLRLKTEDDRATVKGEIKSECDKKTPVGFMNTGETIVTGLSKTNKDLIRENGANHLATFLKSKVSNTDIGVRKRTQAATTDDANEDLNDDDAQDQTESETNLNDRMAITQSGQTRGMKENLDDAEIASTLHREMSYSKRPQRSQHPQPAKRSSQPHTPTLEAAMASTKAEANEIKEEPTVKTEPQWNITKDALRPNKHLNQKSTAQARQRSNATKASSSFKTAGTQPSATPIIPKNPKLLVLQYTPGKDPLEAPRAPKSRYPGPSANSVSSSLSPLPTASPSSSYSVPQLPGYKEARLKRHGMPCANCSRSGVQTHYRGPTGYTFCDACHRLWTADGKPLSWRVLGQNMAGQAFSADAKQTAFTPAILSSHLVDYSHEEAYDSDDFDYSLNSHLGHTKSKPSRAPIVTPSRHPFASMKHSSAGNTAGSSFKTPSSKKRDHEATGPSDHNRPHKMPRKNDAVLSVFEAVSKDEPPEPGEMRESPKEKSIGVGADENDYKIHKQVNSDGKKGLEDTVQTFTMLCRKLFELEKLEKEDQARVQGGDQAVQDAKKRNLGNQNEISGLLVTMNCTEKAVARQRESIAKHVGRKHSGYQQLVQSLTGHEDKRQKQQERFLELAITDMEIDGEETLEDRVKRYRRDLEDTTRELKEVREKLKKLADDGT